MNINQVLANHNINNKSVTRLVQDVRKMYESNGTAALNDVIEDLTGSRIQFPMNANEAFVLGQKMIHDAFLEQRVIGLEQKARAYITEKRVTNPMLFRSIPEVVEPIRRNTSVDNASDEVKQQVNKAGSRALLVEEIYNELVVNGKEPITRSEMINIIVERAAMTPAGASTYFANAKKKLGDPNNMIASSKRSK